MGNPGSVLLIPNGMPSYSFATQYSGGRAAYVRKAYSLHWKCPLPVELLRDNLGNFLVGFRPSSSQLLTRSAEMHRRVNRMTFSESLVVRWHPENGQICDY